MTKNEIEVVYACLENYGDEFWTDMIETFDKDDQLSSNKELFLDILSCLHKEELDLQLVKLDTGERPEREYTIVAVTSIKELSPSWKEIVDKREFTSGTFANFGLAEECIGLLEFKDSFEVGLGECLRPYIQLYIGEDASMASKIFINKINEIKTI